jgi:hypothetical protein
MLTSTRESRFAKTMMFKYLQVAYILNDKNPFDFDYEKAGEELYLDRYEIRDTLIKNAEDGKVSLVDTRIDGGLFTRITGVVLPEEG